MASYEKMSVTELSDIMRRKNLKASGAKFELIRRAKAWHDVTSLEAQKTAFDEGRVTYDMVEAVPYQRLRAISVTLLRDTNKTPTRSMACHQLIQLVLEAAASKASSGSRGVHGTSTHITRVASGYATRSTIQTTSSAQSTTASATTTTTTTTTAAATITSSTRRPPAQRPPIVTPPLEPPDRTWDVEVEANITTQRYDERPVYYTYLLLDARLFGAIRSLPSLEDFKSSVFYVGKGTRDRVDKYHGAAHNPIDTEYHSPKLKRVREIWGEDRGYVIVRSVQDVPEATSLANETAIIAAMLGDGKHLYSGNTRGCASCRGESFDSAVCLANRISGSTRMLSQWTYERWQLYGRELLRRAYGVLMFSGAYRNELMYSRAPSNK